MRDPERHVGIRQRQRDPDRHAGIRQRQRDPDRHAGIRQRQRDPDRHAGIRHRQRDRVGVHRQRGYTQSERERPIIKISQVLRVRLTESEEDHCRDLLKMKWYM
jgi:hypothetical protein